MQNRTGLQLWGCGWSSSSQACCAEPLFKSHPVNSSKQRPGCMQHRGDAVVMNVALAGWLDGELIEWLTGWLTYKLICWLTNSVATFFFFFHWHYSPGWAKASFKRFRHSSRLIAVFFQFLKPALAASSSIPSSQRNLGLPLGRCPPGPVNYTFLAESLSFNRMTCPAQLSLLNL